MRTLKVIARQLTDDIHPEDEGVAGAYDIDVSESLNDAVAASAALDGFHNSVAVRVLDDFEFEVMDPETGETIDEDPDHESYSLSNEAGKAIKTEDAVTIPSVCYNCDNQATHVIKNVHGNGRGFHTPICDTCKTAYENGQASPHATFIEVEEVPYASPTI